MAVRGAEPSLRRMPGNGTARLVIRLMERRDLEDLRQLHNDDSTLFVLTDIAHVSEMQQEAWFQRVSTSRTSRRYVARLRKDDSFVGMFRLDRVDIANRSAYVGADVIATQRGKGFAEEMFGYMLSYLFDQCGLHRLALETLRSNTPAISLYRKLGFVEEGRARDAIFRDGRFRDLLMMGLLGGEWRKRRARAKRQLVAAEPRRKSASIRRRVEAPKRTR